MLDKLIENAMDFCDPGGAIGVHLTRTAGCYELSVGNDGPSIPGNLLGRLFESLFESRQTSDGRPHFGLGLYIVQTLVKQLKGSIEIHDRDSQPGTLFEVKLPVVGRNAET